MGRDVTVMREVRLQDGSDGGEPLYLTTKEVAEMLPTRDPRGGPYVPPKLDITDADRLDFLDSVMSLEPYSETMHRGRVSAKFRVKSGGEVDAITACIGAMDRSGMVGSSSRYLQILGSLNLHFQLMEFSGKKWEKVKIPDRPWKDEDLVSMFDKIHGMDPLKSMSETQVFILCGMLAQFDEKVNRMMREVLDPNFTEPGTPE